MARSLIVCVTALSALLWSFAATAGGGSLEREISTALAHAQMASVAGSLDQVHAHLHHVINCLVGEKGKGFDAEAGNPCQGMGAGALRDAGQASAVHTALEKALRAAESGVRDRRIAAARQAAGAAAEALKTAAPH